ncbi:MAG: sugar transferase [Chloroflexi bacterium]|nr:sugar transferase [Chloroflexota bacterium]MCI0809312.1 sugar transferase [Chloroflexota bacterium]MCI0834143.1 sugar transferase [Chloroflexota bacterium]MCI0836684.1 sugar transferase [Chloroflexota bacterium]MCI0851277.1 sugar transferase [Chloroflexota bacterium]
MAKRLFDLTVAIIGLIVLSPLFLLAAVLVFISLGWPVLYSPTRTARYGSTFTQRKFRSMRIAVGPTSHHSGDDDPRITSTGRFIRRFKLDELPQLWNVLTGDMSLVGPRPEALEYTKMYSGEQMAILDLKPGITDYSSIEFANLGAFLVGGDPDTVYKEQVWNRKMELRMQYVKNHSFWIDLKLLFRTFAAILKRN